MKQDEVPQNGGLTGDWHRITYATNADGGYVLVESEGCDSVNITNAQAWDVIDARVLAVLREISEGTRSVLAYHMVAHQMDESLLAKYAGFYRWQVKRHLKPAGFSRLAADSLQRYADLFELTVEQLNVLPSHSS